MEQRFTLPGLPLHRELQAPVTIGTQFSVRATPIEHDKNTVSLTLVTDKSDAALEITLHLPDKHGRGAKLRAISRTATSESSPLEKEVSTLAVNKELILGVIVKEHVFEIYLDTVFLLPFVHRVNPSDIKKIVLDGAMICNEVVVVPVKTDMPPLPQYNEVSLNTRPLQPSSVPQQPPQPAPRALPPGAVAVLPPYPAGTAGQRPAFSIAKPPEPSWTAPAHPQVVQMPQPHAAAAMQQQPLPPPPAARMPQPQPVLPVQQAMQQLQMPSAPALPPRVGSGAAPAVAMVPTTSAGMPGAPAVAPMQYGGAPLPPQAYPHDTPGAVAPQFQNIQAIPGLSYATGAGQQPTQPYPQQPQQPYQQYPGTPGYYTGCPQGVQYYPTYPVSYYTPSAYGTQYAQYQAFPSVYMNSHCHSSYNYWNHHHHC